MTTLALDLATKTGWASGFLPGESGVWKLGGANGRRVVELGATLTLLPDDITGVVYERPHFRGWDATKALISLVGVVEGWANVRGIPWSCVHTASLKKHATGDGRASKSEMYRAACTEWPELEIVDDNHADALWLLDYGRKTR